MIPPLPEGEVEIRDPGPEAEPPKPFSFWETVLDSIFSMQYYIAMMLGGGLIGLIMNKTSDGAGRFGGGTAVTYLGIMMVLPVFQFLKKRSDHKKKVKEHEEEVEKRAQLHSRAVAFQKGELEAYRKEHQRARSYVNPTPQECFTLVSQTAPRLWERRLKDADFLSLRVGYGSEANSVKVRKPKFDIALAPDALLKEALSLCAEYQRVPNVPVLYPLKDSGILGIAGPRARLHQWFRAQLFNLATHYSPDEVKIIMFLKEKELPAWTWARWLPHVWSGDRTRRFIAAGDEQAKALLDDLEIAIKLRERTHRDGGQDFLPWYVPIFLDGLPKHAVCEMLIERNRELGVCPLVGTNKQDELPVECVNYIDLEGEPRVVYGRTGEVTPFQLDGVKSELLEMFARKLAPLKPMATGGDGQIPDSLTLLQLLDVGSVYNLDVLKLWDENQAYENLSAPIGIKGDGKTLDLEIHQSKENYHGLVAGTTGSGKTAFLTTLLLTFALRYHPHEVTFVAVDFKGGDLFRGLEALPHLVGTLTNLEGSEMRRALRALHAENRRRMQLFNEVSKSTGTYVEKIDVYQRLWREGKIKEPLPKMLIVIDEFAELKASYPEFLEGLVSVARIGRSLGVHLILATQNPVGVITSQIESNMSFRIAFKFQSPDESKAVIGTPDSAAIRQAGRGYYRKGNFEQYEIFQAGWGQAPYRGMSGAEETNSGVRRVSLDGRRKPLQLHQTRTDESEVNQLQATADFICRAAKSKDIARLPGPWLDPLPDLISVVTLTGGRAKKMQTRLALPIGKYDDPDNKKQGDLLADFSSKGNLVVYGRSGSGISTALETLVFSAAMCYSPADINCYIVEPGATTLGGLRRLPHVGGVVATENKPGVARLLRFLSDRLSRRKSRMAEEDLTFRKMRKQKKKRPAAWILLIVENLPRFLESHEEFESLISRLAQEGPSAGVYLIATSPTVGGIKFKLAASFNQTICLKLGDSSEYQQVLGRLEGLEPGDRQGSGLVKAKPPMLVQLAVPVLDETSPADSDRAGLEGVIANFWDKGSAPAIPQLPDNLTFDSHYAEPPDFKGTETVVGLSHLGVEPVLVDLDTAGHLMIAGGPRTGKTNLLANLCLGHARNNTPEQFQLVVVDPKLGSLGPLATLRHTRAYLESAEDFGSVLVQIAKDIKERRDSVKNSRGSKRAAIVAQFSKIVIVIDDFEAFTGDLTQTTRDLFEKLLRSGQGLGLHVIVAGAPGDLVGRGFDSYAKSIFSPRTGFLLGTREDDGAFGHARIGPSLWEMQTGDGYFLERGVVTEQLRTFNLQIDENGFEDRIREISEASEKAGHKRPTPFRVEKLPQSPNGPAGPKVDDEQLNDALAILNSLEA